MKFFLASTGLWMPSWSATLRIAQQAEDLGFWGFVVPDQYMWDARDLGEDSEEGIDATLESWVALSYLAAQTKTIRLGTWVTPLPLRPPAQLAKIVATLDNVSGGRVILGIGAGATKRMFEAYGNWDSEFTRAEKTREALELMMQLWTRKEKLTFHGNYYHCIDAVLEPKPVQKPHPLLLFGGARRMMLRFAGESGDICYIPPWTKLPFDKAKEYVLHAAKASGRNGVPSFAYSFDGVIPPRYDPKTYLNRVNEAVEKGCEYFMAPFGSVNTKPWEWQSEEDLSSLVQSMRDFAVNIMPSFN